MIKYIKSICTIYGLSKIVVFTLILTTIINLSNFLFSYFENNVFHYIDKYLVYLIIIVFLVLLMVFIFKQSYKNKSVIFIDLYTFIAFFSIFINLILYWVSNENYDLRWYHTLVYLLTWLSLIIFIRVYQTYNPNGKVGNLRDLKDLAEGKISKNKPGEIILFEEKEVEYDLLNQENIVNQLIESIQNLTPQSKFIIGLEGEWGSGKSTVLKIVKNKLSKEKSNCIIIDKFDPWHYNDEKAMLEAMLESIIEKVKLGLPSIKTTRLIKEFANTIFKTNDLLLFDSLPTKLTKINDSKIINIINSYLKDNDKKIIFLIDNLDRTQKEHIFFIYKVIASLIDIKRVIYILAYDRNVVNKALKNLQIDDKYLEKIIQVTFKVEPEKEIMNNVGITALKEFYKLSGDFDFKIEEKDYSELMRPFNNLREFKIFLNTLSYLLQGTLKKLNIFDICAVSIIKVLNPTLYNLIRNNSKFFLTEGLIDTPELTLPRIDDKFNQEAQEFFDMCSKLDHWNRFSSLLERLFPVIKRYNKADNKLYREDSEYNILSTKEKRVSNAKYFPVYFYGTINEFILVDDYVSTFISDLNSTNFNSDLKHEYFSRIIDFNETIQILFFETLDLNFDRIELSNYAELIKFLAQLTTVIDNSTGFRFRLNAQSRATVILARLLSKFDIEKFTDILNEFKGDYSKLFLIRNLGYWMSEKAKSSGLYDEDKYSMLDQTLKQMSEVVSENNIDLYDEKLYSRYNASVVVWTLNVNDQTKAYFNTIVTPNNIGKFLYDFMIISSSSNGFGYIMDLKNIHALITDEKVSTLIEQAVENQDDKFVFEVYQKSKGKNISGFENALFRKEEVKLYR